MNHCSTKDNLDPVVMVKNDERKKLRSTTQSSIDYRNLLVVTGRKKVNGNWDDFDS